MSGNSLERPHPYGCRCAGCTVRTALALIETGRPGKAVPLLERVPALIIEECGHAYARGHDDVVTSTRTALVNKRRELRDLDAKIGRARRELDGLAGLRSANAKWLAEALAGGRTTPGRVAELLKIRPEDVPPIAEGRVGLAA